MLSPDSPSVAFAMIDLIHSAIKPRSDYSFDWKGERAALKRGWRQQRRKLSANLRDREVSWGSRQLYAKKNAKIVRCESHSRARPRPKK
jgi:hypothetical protein